MQRHVVRFSTLVVLAVVLGSGSTRAQDTNPTAAQSAVETWLALIDSQSYAASWDTAAIMFRNAINQEKWRTAVQAARTPFGQMKSRALKSATATTTLPGAPDGEYVVFQFTTSFDNKAAAIETVTAMREKDGTWHVGGYFIK
jgi:outer membrane protein assembly factor BamB